MDVVHVRGGVSLSGEVAVSGAKNASLLMLAAALLTDEVCILRNVPSLRDVHFLLQLLERMGVEVVALGEHTWQLHARTVEPSAPYELVRQMRASVCLLGPLIGRLRRASLSLPGGCVIGNRPIDLHLNGFRKLGCEIALREGTVHVDAEKLKGSQVFLGGRYGSTVTGTANLLMAASLTPGVTIIESAACEPEVVDLCRLLVCMGGEIEGIGSPCLIVRGKTKLSGFDYSVIGDRIEAGTFLVASLITNGTVRITGFNPGHLGALIHMLEMLGASLEVTSTGITVYPSLGGLKAFELTTLPYPGFPTDLQAQMCVLAACIPGLSLLTEKIYPNRFMHVSELQRLGAQVTLEGPTAIVQGGGALSGAEVMASDLRASAALYLAGLVAEGTTHVHRVYHLDRGYEAFDQKLRALGADIERDKE